MKTDSPLLENGRRRIDLEDVTTGAIRAILADVHGKKEEIKEEDLWEIRKAADKYLFMSLKA